MYKRIVFFVILAAVLMAVLGAIDVMVLTTPEQLRARLASEAAEQLNADVECDLPQHPVFSSKAYVNNLRLKSRGPDAHVFFAADKITLSLNYFSFFRGQLLKSAVFERPVLTVRLRPQEAVRRPPRGTAETRSPLETLVSSKERAKLPRLVFHDASVIIHSPNAPPSEISGINLVIDPAGALEKNSITLAYRYDEARQIQVNVTHDPVTNITRIATSGREPNYFVLDDHVREILDKLARSGDKFSDDFLDGINDLGLGGSMRVESLEAVSDPSKEESQRLLIRARLQFEDGVMTIKEFPYTLHLTGGLVEIDGIDMSLSNMKGRNDGGRPGTMEGHGTIRNFLSHHSEVDLTLTAREMPIDEKLHQALLTEDLGIHQSVVAIWRNLHPGGVVGDAVILIRKQPAWDACKAGVIVTLDGRATGSYTYVDTDDVARTVAVSDVAGNVDFKEEGTRVNAKCKVAGVTVNIENGLVTKPGSPDSEMNIEGVTDVFEISDAVLNVLPERTRKDLSAGNPTGKLKLKISLTKKKDQAVPDYSIEILALGTGALLKDFPYRLENIEGTLYYGQNRVWTKKDKDITATHGKAKIRAKIDVDLAGKSPVYDLEISGDGVPLDRDLYNALPAEIRKQVDDYVPPSAIDEGKGLLNMVLRVKGSADHPEISTDIAVSGATLKSKYFPYLIKDVGGVLKIGPGGVTLEGVHGAHGEAKFWIEHEPDQEGKQHNKIQTDSIDIIIKGTSVALDEDLRSALGEDFSKFYDSLKPKGTVDVSVNLTRKGAENIRPVVTIVSNKTMEFTYASFPLTATEVQAEIRVTPENVLVTKFGCKLGTIDIPFDQAKNHCEITLGKQTHFVLDIGEIKGIHIDDALKNALPKGLRDSLNRMEVRADLNITDMKLDIIISGARSKYSCQFTADVKNGALGEKPVIDKLSGVMKVQFVDNPGEQATANGTSFENLDFYIRGLHVGGLSGTVKRLDAAEAGLANPADPHRVDFTASMYSQRKEPNKEPNITEGFFIFCLGDSKEYRGGFEFNSVDLTSLHSDLIHKQSKLSGTMSGKVEFKGEGEDFGNLQGAGRLDIADGDIGALPLIFSLNGLLKLNLQRQVVKDAHLEFNIKDKAFNFDVMQFKSQSVTFVGYGKVGFDEKLDMVVFSDTQLNGIPGVEQMMRWFKKQLYAAQVKGTFEKPEISSKAFSLITEIPAGVRKVLGGD
jgi:hypothetical protein